MKDYLGSGNWAPDVRSALNQLIDEYRAKDASAPHQYAVFDFDNTVSIFDAEEQTCWYQLEHMCFSMTPDELRKAMLACVPHPDQICKDKRVWCPYSDWIEDITDAYRAVYNDMGPFTAEGLSEKELAALEEHPCWPQFASKMGCFYDVLNTHLGASVSDTWMLHWFLGMTPEEIYQLTRRALRHQSAKQTTSVLIQDKVTNMNCGRLGVRYNEFQLGISVTDEMRSLFKALHDNGIDVWICSASHIDVIRGAIDEFGLHDSLTGLIGMTPLIKDGRMTTRYDYDTGYAYLPLSNGDWKRGNISSHTKTDAEGKVSAIQNVLLKEYQSGPIAGFMDSGGDFAFCTSFASMRLCVCFDRMLDACNNGGGLIEFVADYQRDALKMTYNKALESNDTLYVKQGRNEYKHRGFLPKNNSFVWCPRFADDDDEADQSERIECNETVQAMYEAAAERNMSVKDILWIFSVLTDENDSDNPIPGHRFGFLPYFRGYHTIKDGTVPEDALIRK